MKDKIEVMNRLLEGQSALDLVAEQNGNHVIQKCIECIKPASKLEPLVQASNPLEALASHCWSVVGGAKVKLHLKLAHASFLKPNAP